MDDYDKKERIAIKMDSHISERDAIKQTDTEIKKVPESISRLKALQERKRQDDAKKTTRFSYD